MSERQQWYREVYLTSEYWQNKRQEMLNYYNNKCCMCGSANLLNVHHLHYNIDEETPINEWEGKESDKSLVVLCRECHSHIHNVKKEEEIKIGTLISKYSNIIKSKKYSIEEIVFMYWQEVNEIIVSAMESFFKGRKTKHLMRLSSYFNDGEFFNIFHSIKLMLIRPIYEKARKELPPYSQLYSQRNNPTKNTKKQ